MKGILKQLKHFKKTIASEFEKYAKIKKNIPEEALASVANAEDPRQLVDLIAGHLGIEVEEKQKLLENLIISERLEQAYSHMQSEVSVLQVEKKDKNPCKVTNGTYSAGVLSKRANESHSERTW